MEEYIQIYTFTLAGAAILNMAITRFSYKFASFIGMIALLGIYLGAQERLLSQYTDIEPKLLIMASTGVLIGLFISNLWVVFIGPLLGIWKPFSSCAVYVGTVKNAKTYTSHYADTTSHVNSLGQIQSNTEFSSLSTDVITLSDGGEITRTVDGEGIGRRVAYGDKVLLAGVPGKKHFMFSNLTRGMTYDNKPEKLSYFLGTILTFLIPVLGTIVLLWLFIKEHIAPSGVTGAGPFEQESRHIWLMTVVHFLVALFCFNEFNDSLEAAATFYAIMIPFALLLGVVWRRNCLRYQKYVSLKAQASFP